MATGPGKPELEFEALGELEGEDQSEFEGEFESEFELEFELEFGVRVGRRVRIRIRIRIRRRRSQPGQSYLSRRGDGAHGPGRHGGGDRVPGSRTFPAAGAVVASKILPLAARAAPRLAAKVLPRVARVVSRVTPRLTRGVTHITRALHRNPQTRHLVRVIPSVARRAVTKIARHAAAGHPVTPRHAARILRHEHSRVIRNPRLVHSVLRHANRMDRRYQQVGGLPVPVHGSVVHRPGVAPLLRGQVTRRLHPAAIAPHYAAPHLRRLAGLQGRACPTCGARMTRGRMCCCCC